MVLRETICLRALGGDRAGEEQAGRFFANKKVTAEKIVASWSERTGAASAGRHVLAIQDTTDVTFATGKERRRGLGQLNQGNAFGVLAHIMIAVDADSRACLGLVGGKVWNREGLVTTRSEDRPLEARESRRWVEAAEQAREVLAPAAMVTVLCDREGDIYPLWATIPDGRVHVLTRVMVNRRLAEGGLLFDAAEKFAVAGTRTVEIPAQPPQRAKRDAKLEIRFGAVTIKRSPNEKDRWLARTVRLSLVEVREIAAPEGIEAIHWRLMTTHDVADAAMAWRIVGWYQTRWTIEQLNRTMKSQGLRLEDSQLDTAERLVKLTAAAVKAACITMQLVQERDGLHGRAATDVFGEEEIDTFEALTPTLEGRTERQKNPHPPRSLARASWVAARLGGWNCYYRPPGPITMARGLERFHAIHQGRMIGSRTK